MGFIDLAQFRAAIEVHSKSEYGRYLRQVLTETEGS